MGIQKTTACLGLLALGAMSPSLAWGEEAPSPVVTILGLRASPQHHEALERARSVLGDAARSLGAVIVDRGELRQRRDDALPRERAARVEGLREEARQAFLDFRFADAAVSLEQARTLLFGRLADLYDDPVYLAVSLDLARVWLDMRQPELAREALHEVIRVAPAYRPAAGDYPPQLIAAFHAARRSAESRGRAEAPEAGRLVLAGLTSGVSYVIGGTVSPGGAPSSYALRLIVVECSTGDITRPDPIALGPDDSWEAALRAPLAPLLLPPARYDDPETSFFVMTTPPGAAVEVDGRDTEVVTPETVGVDPGLHRLRLTLEGYAPQELTITAWRHQTRPVEVALRRGDERSVVRAWWLWTLVGVAAAGAITGLVIWAVAADADLPDVTVTPTGAGVGWR